MAWLTGYQYRKSITLSRASGAVTNYQMKLLVGESAGATGEDVDCNSHVQTDFDDLRFTASDGTTLLDYWIELITGTTPNQLATVWIEFDSIGTGATTFYMYYGKVDATAYSNIQNTFIFADDFDDNSLDTTTRWNTGNSGGVGSINEASQILTIAATGNGSAYLGYWVISKSSYSFSAGARFRVYLQDLLAVQSVFTNIVVEYDGSNNIRFMIYRDASGQAYYLQKTVGGSGSTIKSEVPITDVDRIVDLLIDGTNVTLLLDGTSWQASIAHGLAQTSGKVKLTHYTYPASSQSGNFNNVLVGNWRAIEPAWGTWGSEGQESQSWEYAGNISFSLTPSATYFANYPNYNGAITSSILNSATYFMNAPPYNGAISLSFLSSAVYFLDTPPYQGAVIASLISGASYFHDHPPYTGAIDLSLVPVASFFAIYPYAGTISLELIPNSVYEYQSPAEQWQYNGAVTFVLSPTATYFANYLFAGAVLLELIPNSTYEYQVTGWQYSGDVSLSLTTSSTCFANYEYDGISLLTLTPGATYSHHFSFSGTITTSLIPGSVYFLDHPPYSGAVLLNLVPVSIYGWDHPPYNGAIFVSLLPASPSFANYVFSGVLLFDLIPNSAYQFDEGGFSWNGNVFISPLPSSSYAPAFAFLGGIGISLNPLADYLHVPSLLIFIYDGQVITSLFVSAETELWRTILVPASSIYGYERIEERPVEGLPEDGYVYLQEMIK